MIIKLAKKFPDINFIIKCKVGQKIPKNLEYQFKKIKNIDLIKHGLGHELIEKSQIILGLNSAATIETLLAKKLLMVPFFGIERKIVKNFLYNYPKENIFLNYNKFEETLNNNLIKGYITKKKFNTSQEKTINKYLGDYINAKKI